MRTVKNKGFTILIMCVVSLSLFSCNYNYHQGLRLEEEGRYEEANIEYHRAYTKSPGNDDYKSAYERTAKITAEDLINRYHRYVEEKRYFLAYRRLEQARALAPDLEVIKAEQKKWYKVLLAGKVDLVGIKSLRNQLPLSDKIEFTVRLNTPNAKNMLEAIVNYQNKTFSVEDILYDPPQDILMLYSVNSIGVKLVNQATRREQFKKFIDFQTPVPISIQGKLAIRSNTLTSVTNMFPADKLRESNSQEYWFPSKGYRYSLLLEQDAIQVESGDDHIEYLPQMLYINSQDHRYFLDFGHYELSQPNGSRGQWALRRAVSSDRPYLDDLRKNLLLNSYFYYREGAYPFLLNE